MDFPCPGVYPITPRFSETNTYEEVVFYKYFKSDVGYVCCSEPGKCVFVVVRRGIRCVYACDYVSDFLSHCDISTTAEVTVDVIFGAYFQVTGVRLGFHQGPSIVVALG
jgi:hypothetical protein